MVSWDRAALRRLEAVRTDLAQSGVLELVQAVVAEVWDANVARHEPDARGDTERSLGLLSVENVRVLISRQLTGRMSPWPARGVEADTPHGCLTIHAGGVAVRLKKAPNGDARSQNWAAFDWPRGSATHFEAASRNAAVYVPAQEAHGQTVLAAVASPPARAAALKDVCLVWQGDLETGLTTGWPGLPTLGLTPWLAMTRLWSHQPVLEVQEYGTALRFEAPGSAADKGVPVTLKATARQLRQ